MTEAPDIAIPLWLVAFMPSAQPAWYQRFLDPQFQHVEAIGWCERGRCWIQVTPSPEMALVTAFDDADFAAYMAALHERGAVVVAARTEAGGPNRPRLLGTCVTAISTLLGLPGPCAVRPIGLYRTLLARGAEEIVHGQRVQRTETECCG